ncbi:MAG: hypothetical protein V4591_05320 [Bdellovibrionota bacterium]
MQSPEQLQAEIEKLRAENNALKSEKIPAASKEISFKIAEKGGLSVYGLGRFPVTLYKEQWTKLLDKADDIRNFLSANADKLKTKD